MSRQRAEIVGSLLTAGRDQASWTLLMHRVIAARFGLGPTDMKCLDLARDEDHLTAGRLAETTGLSTSAVTSVIDRLERQGFVERIRDDRDRRKVRIRPTGRNDAAASAIFEQVAEGFQAVLDDYGDAELELLDGFIRRLNEQARQLATSLAHEPPDHPNSDR